MSVPTIFFLNRSLFHTNFFELSRKASVAGFVATVQQDAKPATQKSLEDCLSASVVKIALVHEQSNVTRKQNIRGGYRHLLT